MIMSKVFFEKILSKNIKNARRKKKILLRKIKCLNSTGMIQKIKKTNPISKNFCHLIFSNKFKVFFLKSKSPDFLEKNELQELNLKKNIIIGNIGIDFKHSITQRLDYSYSYEIIYIYIKFKNTYVWFPFCWPKLCVQQQSNNNFSIFFFKNNIAYWLNFSIISVYRGWLKKIIKCIYNFIFLKMRYKGKHYRWYRKKKGIVLRFGHSHLVLQTKKNFVFLKKRGKIKLLFFGTNFYLMRTFLTKLTCWCPINVYTARGIRFSKQMLMRKEGKVSIYR